MNKFIQLFAIVSGLLIAFQNCGTNFESADLSSLSDDDAIEFRASAFNRITEFRINNTARVYHFDPASPQYMCAFSNPAQFYALTGHSTLSTTYVESVADYPETVLQQYKDNTPTCANGAYSWDGTKTAPDSQQGETRAEGISRVGQMFSRTTDFRIGNDPKVFHFDPSSPDYICLFRNRDQFYALTGKNYLNGTDVISVSDYPSGIRSELITNPHLCANGAMSWDGSVAYNPEKPQDGNSQPGDQNTNPGSNFTGVTDYRIAGQPMVFHFDPSSPHYVCGFSSRAQLQALTGKTVDQVKDLPEHPTTVAPERIENVHACANGEMTW